MSQTPPKRPPTPLPFRRPTPGRGVPQVVIEDPTPIDLPPMLAMDRRTKQTKEQVDTTLSTVYAVNEKVGILGKQHDELKTDVRELREKVTDLATSSAHVHGKLDILVKLGESQQRVIEHREKITIEREATESKLELEDIVDEKKFKRQKWLKILGALLTIAGAVTAGITALLGKC